MTLTVSLLPSQKYHKAYQTLFTLDHREFEVFNKYFEIDTIENVH